MNMSNYSDQQLFAEVNRRLKSDKEFRQKFEEEVIEKNKRWFIEVFKRILTALGLDVDNVRDTANWVIKKLGFDLRLQNLPKLIFHK